MLSVTSVVLQQIHYIYKGSPHDWTIKCRKTHDLAGADPGFGQGGGPQLPRLKVAELVKRSHVSEVSYLWPGSF